jgi:hypothetical protein
MIFHHPGAALTDFILAERRVEREKDIVSLI